MVKMMALMMEMMSRMMLGGSFGDKSYPYPYSSMPYTPFSAYPMSPTSPYNNFLFSPYTSSALMPSMGPFSADKMQQYSPFQQAITAKNLEDQLLTQNNPFSINANSQSLNGIWKSRTGDIIAIYSANEFIWSNGKERYLGGKLSINGSQLSFHIRSKNSILNFQFYREKDNFAIKSEQGHLYVFKRIY